MDRTRPRRASAAGRRAKRKAGLLVQPGFSSFGASRLLLGGGSRQDFRDNRCAFDSQGSLLRFGGRCDRHRRFDDGLGRIQYLLRRHESHRLACRPDDDDRLMYPVTVCRGIDGLVCGGVAIDRNMAVHRSVIDRSVIDRGVVDWRMVANNVPVNVAMMAVVTVAEALMAVTVVVTTMARNMMAAMARGVVSMAMAVRAGTCFSDARCGDKSEDGGDGEESFHGGNPFLGSRGARVGASGSGSGRPVSDQRFMTQFVNDVHFRVNRELSVSL